MVDLDDAVYDEIIWQDVDERYWEALNADCAQGVVSRVRAKSIWRELAWLLVGSLLGGVLVLLILGALVVVGWL